MDGFLKKKNKIWRGQMYSETRYSLILWLEKELPKITGDVLNIAAGGWLIPKQLLTNSKLGKYFTYDQKFYGDSKNPVKMYGDAHQLPKKWDNRWDCVIMNQALECMKNPFIVIKEMYRVLKPGGTILIDTPFAVSWFGYGAYPDTLKKKFPVKDYWRITPQGLEMLLMDAGFKKEKIAIETSGPNKWDCYCVMAKAIK